MGWLTPRFLEAAFLFHYDTSLFRSKIYAVSRLLLVHVLRCDDLQMLPVGTAYLEEFGVGKHGTKERGPSARLSDLERIRIPPFVGWPFIFTLSFFHLLSLSLTHSAGFGLN